MHHYREVMLAGEQNTTKSVCVLIFDYIIYSISTHDIRLSIQLTISCIEISSTTTVEAKTMLVELIVIFFSISNCDLFHKFHFPWRFRLWGIIGMPYMPFIVAYMRRFDIARRMVVSYDSQMQKFGYMHNRWRI